MHPGIIPICCQFAKALEGAPLSNVALYTVAVLIWGTTWFAIEFQLGIVAPEVSVFYRFLLASVILFIWCKVKGLNLSFNPKSHIFFALMGLLMFGLNYILAYRAQVYITSALSAIAFCSIVWMNILNSRLFFGVRADRRTYFGAFTGFVGILVIFAPQVSEVSLSDGLFFGSLLAVSGAVMASFGNMASQQAQRMKAPVVQSNAWSMLYGAVFTGIIALLQGHEFTLETSAAYIVSFVYLTVFGSVIAFGAYLTLLGRIGAHKAGYASVMFPVIALILSTLFEGMSLDASIVGGFLLVLGGNVLILRKS